jgi:hypothetical protein
MNRNIKFFPQCLTTILLLGAGLFSLNANAQGIGFNNNSAAANNSAMVDISSGTAFNRGLLIPRVTAAQRTANFNAMSAPAQGLMVYQTDNTAPGEGLYMNTSTTTAANWVKIGSTAWGLNGNSGTAAGTNFLGTTDANGLDIRTSNAIRMSILSGGNVGIGATNPAVKLAVGGNGTNVYGTDEWVENNIHVQGNEAVGAGRGRLRVGTAWGYVGLYSDANSVGATNDLVIGASSGIVRIGPGGTAQKLLLPTSTGFQMVDNAAAGKIMLSDASGNASWQAISAAMQIYTLNSSQTSITTSTYTDVGGLTQTLTLTANAWVIINTTGSIESQGGVGTYSRAIIGLNMNGSYLQEQATDIVNPTSPGVLMVVNHWGITHAVSLAPGTYTFKIQAKVWSGSGVNAGGATTTGLPSDGAMCIEVYPQ